MKEPNTTPLKPKTKLADLIANWAVGRFVGFYFVYKWLGNDEAKATIVDASNIQYFAVFKAVILMCAMGCAILAGIKIIEVARRLQQTVRIVDIEDDTGKPS